MLFLQLLLQTRCNFIWSKITNSNVEAKKVFSKKKFFIQQKYFPLQHAWFNHCTPTMTRYQDSPLIRLVDPSLIQAKWLMQPFEITIGRALSYDGSGRLGVGWCNVEVLRRYCRVCPTARESTCRRWPLRRWPLGFFIACVCIYTCRNFGDLHVVSCPNFGV
jgi:hypothetical protein